jgi:hypothetical protein
MKAVPKPLHDGSSFQSLYELMMMLQLATAASKLIAAPCEAPLWKASLSCKCCKRDFDIILSSAICFYDLKNDEDLACELSRESDPACYQLCGAPLSDARFDAYAAGCTKSTLSWMKRNSVMPSQRSALLREVYEMSCYGRWNERPMQLQPEE